MVAINRIVFMGTPEFAVPSLRALLHRGENVVSVVTQPDRAIGRGRKIMPPAVKQLAVKAAIPVLQPQNIRGDDFLAVLATFAPDLIVLTAYGKILPPEILHLPPAGVINVHASLLPKYRGAAPIQWALIRGETETGVTVMQMDEGMDTGDILLQKKIPVMPEDTAGTLSGKLAELGGEALDKVLDLLYQDRLHPIKQDDRQASPAPPLRKEDGIIDWTRSALHISGLIRGLDPWPTASTTLSGKRLRLFSPEVVSDITCQNRFEPGAVCSADRNGLLVKTGDDSLLVKEIQAEGSRRLDVGSFVNGRPIHPGTILGQ